MLSIFALDPGPGQSSFVQCTFTGDTRLLGAQLILDRVFVDVPNDGLLGILHLDSMPEHVVFEDMIYYGQMSHCGKSIFDTCRWCGRFEQILAMRNGSSRKVIYLPRQTVKTMICNNSLANDSDVRRALIDRFGEPGTKKHPGALYGVSGHCWQALGLAVAYASHLKNNKSTP